MSKFLKKLSEYFWNPAVPALSRPALVFPIALVFGIGVGSSLNASSSDSGAYVYQNQDFTSETEPTAGVTVSNANLGEVGGLGSFEVTAISVDCSSNSIATEPPVVAKGRFCLLALQIKNASKESDYFDPRDVYLIGKDGARYEHDYDASWNFENRFEQSESYNPGIVHAGMIVYDVSATDEGGALEIERSDDGELKKKLKISLN